MTICILCLQILGGMGVCQDTPLPEFYTWARVMKIGDGPDEVHCQNLARKEFLSRGYNSKM